MDNQETKFSTPIKCNHCSNKAPMKIVADFHQNEAEHDEITGKIMVTHGSVYKLLLCPACDRVILMRTDWHEAWESENESTILYPAELKPISGLPELVKKAYEEATRVRAINPNAFAVLLGRLLDIICEDRKAKGRVLSEKIKNLATRGEIPDRLAKITHSLKQLRNIGAHADLGELSENEIPFLDDLCRAILEYVYSAPELLNRVEERLKKIRGN